MTFRLKPLIAGAGLSACAALAMAPGDAASCAPDPYIGSICATAVNYCPRQYSPAEGQILNIAQNTALFSLIGCIYGGDCRTTFALPDYRGRSLVGTGIAPGLSDVRLGLRRGEETVTLTVENLAPHSHNGVATFTGATIDTKVTLSASSDATSVSPATTGSYLMAAPRAGFDAVDMYTGTGTGLVELGGLSATSTFTGGGATVNVSDTGSGTPFEILPPQIGVQYCIAISGLFPPRN